MDVNTDPYTHGALTHAYHQVSAILSFLFVFVFLYFFFLKKNKRRANSLVKMLGAMGFEPFLHSIWILFHCQRFRFSFIR